ncbi:response regulator transcription factor [Raoultibacter massiliensis]|uniref:helix-turn-helix transcriptional regulator n=1 Tax=Raoultibacter massiliensis TaxID=1852371 RepID=UPI003A8CE2C5
MGELKAIASSQGMISILGLSLMLSWIYGPFLSGETFYISFHLGFGCSLLIAAFVYHLHPHGTSLVKAAPWIAATLMLFAPLSVFTFADSSEIGEITCGVICSGGGAYCFSRWFAAFCTAPLKTAASYTLLAFSLSSCIRFLLVLLYGIAPFAVGIALAIAPFLSAALLQRVPAAPLQGNAPLFDPSATTPKLGKRVLGFAIIGIEIVTYGFVFGLLRNGISEWSTSTSSMLVGHLLRIVLPLLLFFWLAARAHSARGDGWLRSMLLIIVVILLAGLFFGGMAESVLSAIVLAMRSFVSILIYLLLFDAMKHTGLHPCIVYGIGRALYELSLVAGLFVYRQAMVTGFSESLPFNVIYFAISCVALLLLNSFSRTTKLAPAPSIPFEPNSIDMQCNRIATSYALTNRELEIMKMICRGRSKKYIAGELFLSEDTIRWHTKQLYRKLEIHNRQELLTKIGIE